MKAKVINLLLLCSALLLAGCNSGNSSSTSGSSSSSSTTSGSSTSSSTSSSESSTSEDPEFHFEPLKIGVFADVQLCLDNQGSTANALLALKKQVKFSKEQNVDVLIMDGDIVNNALPKVEQSTDEEAIYKKVENVFKDVYGEESNYPEIVSIMGNHEWWDNDEHQYPASVARFKKYAHIQSSNLVKTSDVTLDFYNNEKAANYYKVVKGVPFVGISAEECDGLIGTEMKAELSSWFQEISQLETVKAGGPIYVSYHYPISGVSYQFGQHTNETTTVLNDILKDYPQVILFTGDTHFTGVNERTIWQKKYTTINIGSSSYSRSINRSGSVEVMSDTETFYNVPKDVIKDDTQFLYEYATNYQIVNLDTQGNSVISRYMTEDNPKDSRKVNIDWTIPVNSNTANFAYGVNRIANKENAKELYGANGLSFAGDANATYAIDEKGNLVVNFPDVTNHNCVEHYRIKVNDTKKYEFLSQSYKYDKDAHQNHYVIKADDLPGPVTKVEVSAYDFFDNPSLNSLIATSGSQPHEKIDYALNQSYSDISKRLNYEDAAPGKNSSIEYYYRGNHLYNAGAIMNRVFLKDGVSAKEELSIGNEINLVTILKCKVKNLDSNPIVLGLIVVNGAEEWLSDFNESSQKEVAANSGWVDLEWNLTDLFAIKGRADMSNISFKVKSNGQNENGYEMHFLVSDTDIYSNGVAQRGVKFTAGFDTNIKFAFVDVSTGTIKFDYKLENNGHIAMMIFNDNKDEGGSWDDYFGYFDLYKNTASFTGVHIDNLADGYRRVTITLNDLTKIVGTKPTKVNHIYIRGGYTDGNGYIDLNPEVDPPVIRGLAFDANVSKNFTAFDTSTGNKLVIDMLITTDPIVATSKIEFLLTNDGWNPQFTHIVVYPDGTLSRNYGGGITTEILSDGYIRVTFDFDIISANADAFCPSTINATSLNVIRFNNSSENTVQGYYDINPTI